MKEYKVTFHPEFEKQLNKLNKADKKSAEKAIEIIKRNPYSGEEIGVSSFEKFKNKCKYYKRELEIKVRKWRKNMRK